MAGLTQVLLSALLLFAGSSSAAPTDIRADEFLIGEWQCSLERPGQPRRAEEAHYTFDLGGKWLALRYRELDNGKAVSETQAYETYDPKLGKWAYTSFSSDGYYGTTYSDGWIGDRKVYRPSPSDKRQFTHTTVKLNERRFTERVDIPASTGSKTIFLLDCTKQ